MHHTLINKRYAVHDIHTEEIPFDSEKYSEFKFGNLQIAKDFAEEMYRYLCEHRAGEFRNKKVIIYSSPYKTLPTSSYYLTKFLYEMMECSDELGLESLEFGKIMRNQTYTDDYGALSAADRLRLIENDTYAFPELPSSDRVLLFVDDVSITGTHQVVVEKLLTECRLENEVFFFYYSKLANQAIPPTIENKMNYSQIKSVHDVLPLLASDDFGITTRLTKFLLAAKAEEFKDLLAEMVKLNKADVLRDIYAGALANDYHTFEAYHENLTFLASRVQYA